MKTTNWVLVTMRLTVELDRAWLEDEGGILNIHQHGISVMVIPTLCPRVVIDIIGEPGSEVGCSAMGSPHLGQYVGVTVPHVEGEASVYLSYRPERDV